MLERTNFISSLQNMLLHFNFLPVFLGKNYNLDVVLICISLINEIEYISYFQGPCIFIFLRTDLLYPIFLLFLNLQEHDILGQLRETFNLCMITRSSNNFEITKQYVIFTANVFLNVRLEGMISIFERPIFSFVLVFYYLL